MAEYIRKNMHKLITTRFWFFHFPKSFRGIETMELAHSGRGLEICLNADREYEKMYTSLQRS